MKRSAFFKVFFFISCAIFAGSISHAAGKVKSAPAPGTDDTESSQMKVTVKKTPLAKSAAEKTLKFHFDNAELKDIIAAYAKASGQKFVIDPSVKGKASILNTKDTSITEAFALLSSALAVNSFAISEQGDTMIVESARTAERSLIPLYKELPDLKPERMASMVFELKFVSADEINKRLRILPSKDGEMTPYQPTNKLFVTDWVSNIRRIAEIINEIDQPAPGTAADAKAWKSGNRKAEKPENKDSKDSKSDSKADPKPSPAPDSQADQ
jgi:type II secretory pathway component GspD/PulD (secretin)